MPPNAEPVPETIDLSGDDWLLKDFYGEDWKWRSSYMPDTTDVRWWRAGSVPGSVLDDLWRLGEVPNPYFERNTLTCEWVPQRTWLYRKRFHVAENLEGRRVRLHFKGVDYTGHFYLNGKLLGSHTGMYTPAVFEVSEQLQYGGENWIAVVIEAAPHEEPQVGYTSRVHTHKSRMGYWWDFCPRMVHQGIWDSVFLEVSGPVRIDDVFARPVLTPVHTTATLHLELALDTAAATEAAATGQHTVELRAAITCQGEPVTEQREDHTLLPGRTSLSMQLEIPSPRLWWPNGYGEQPLYQAEVTVTTADGLSHRRVMQFGIRSLEMVQNEGASPDALPYTLVVNGQRMYIKGWNWVPIDALYGVPRPEKRARLLKLAQKAHVNLLRVWGGGLIEKDDFYEDCDRLGILVWQEFIQSSSGIDNQPSSAPEFIELLTREAEQIIPRKRNHPSLALWCGGNELQAGAEQPLNDSHPTLAGLKEVVNRLDPDRLWLATSPTGRVFSNSMENFTKDPSALHDVHGPWEYQGETRQYALYNQGASLLHSEFGVEGVTNLKTLNAVIDPQHQWPVLLDTNPYWWHLGAWWVRRKVWDQVFGALPDVAAYVRATQFTQYDGLRYALEADRRRKYHNSGTLPWQFNEPYPMAACTSAVDYYTRPKPAYYAVAKAYAPLHVSAAYPTLAWTASDFESVIWLHNSGLAAVENAVLHMRLVGASGTVYASQQQRVSCGPDRAVRANEFSAPLDGVETVFLLDLLLADAQGKLLADNCYTFTRRTDAEPPLLPLFHTPVTTLDVQFRAEADLTEMSITNTGRYTAMFVWLEDERALERPGSVYFDDNYFCLFPGESRNVRATWEGVPPAERRLSVQGWNTNRSEA